MSKLILILMYLVSVSSLTTISLFPKKENIKSNVFKINVMKNLNKLSESVLGFPYELPKLNYSYNDLEPNIDESTMNIHYNKHHGAYVTNLNNALKGSDLEKTPLVELFKNIDKAPVAVRNNGGGHYNHTLFWELLTPKGSEKPEGELAEAIEKQFGSFEKFKELFTDAAVKRFGSGWAWLAIDNQGNLFVSSTPNQDNPLMNVAEKQGIPLIGLDVWEHAYYLKYQNRRLDYINSFWNIINWDIALERYKKVTQ